MKPIVRIFTVFLVWIVLVAGGRAEEKPVEIRVVDSKTGEPVKRFRYAYEIISPDKHAYPLKGKNLLAENDRGVAVIPAPRRLSLLVYVASPDHLPKEWVRYSEFKVFPEGKRRRFEIKLKPGEEICGVVLDAKDGNPIADVEVAPLDSVNTGFGAHGMPNWARSVRTGNEGRFCLGGDRALGVATRRKGYGSYPKSYEESQAKQETRKTPDGKTEIVIRLRRHTDPEWEDWCWYEDQSKNRPTGEKLFRGMVTVADDPQADGKCTVIVAAVRDKTWWWDAAWPWSRDPPETKDHIRLDGVPLGREWSAPITMYEDDNAYYVAAWREGFAPAALRVSTDKDFLTDVALPEAEATVRPNQFIGLELKRGVRISGRVEGPGVADGTAVAMLFPSKYLSDWRFDNELEWLTRTAKVARDGSFQFDEIEPGLFRLQVLSTKAGPFERMVIVGRQDKQLGPCRIEPFGRIEGVIYDLPGMYYTNVSDTPVGLRIMAPASWGRRIIFNYKLGLDLFGPDKLITDEKGRFVIEQVPAGETFVGFKYRLSIDCENYSRANVVVPPGKTAHVALNVPPGQTEGLVGLPLDVVIGDGSFDAFCAAWGRRDRPTDTEDSRFSWFFDAGEELDIDCRLSPVDESPQESKGHNRWAEQLKKGAQRVVLADAAPGEYRLEVGDYHAWKATAPLFQQTIRIVAESGPKPINVPLPASSIDIELKHPPEEVFAFVGYAVFRDGQKQPFRRGGFSGTYASERKPRMEAVHFVPPGKYEMLLWGEQYGWVRSGPIEVREGAISSAGRLTFQPGGKVAGRVFLDRESTMPSHVTLVDEAGVQRRAEITWRRGSFTFGEGSLWPGRWTAKVMGGNEEVLVEKSFEVLGCEPIELQMEGK